jgi:general secretion pathway protein A
MEYYKLLQLEREPFSNSPDPDYFFQSEQHLGCLQKLELALRLKRGLNVVLGDVGSGKTTLCRQLIRSFAGDDGVESHLILDPAFDHSLAFLSAIHAFFHPDAPKGRGPVTEGQLKEAIQQHLFTKGVDQNKTIVLIIDEGQKISGVCVEILRELLNYETNTFKLLQIVIFAQLEFERILEAHANFADRINLLHHLAPMNFRDTRRMVQHRIKLSSTGPKPKQLFTLPAMWAIYRSSKGYPRKIIHLCHQSILAMIIQNRTRAGWAIIVSCKKRLAVSTGGAGRTYLVYGGIGLIMALALAGLFPSLWPVSSPKPPVPPLRKVEPNPPDARFPVPLHEPMAEASQTSPAPETLPESALAMAVSPLEHPNAPSPSIPEDHSKPLSGMQAPHHVPDKKNRSEGLPPEILGHLIVQPGDTLEHLASAVYGSRRDSRLKAVIQANPHIRNPNNISIGDIVKFPLIAVEPVVKDHPCYWVILDDFPSLPSTMQRLLEVSNTMVVPLQVIPHWHPESGLGFFLIIKGYFDDETEAISYTQALPDSIMRNGWVISTWPEPTRFYADPYEGGILNSPISAARQ